MEHAASAAVRWSPSVRHSSEWLAHDVHLHGDSLQIHLLELLHLLLLLADIIHGGLALPSALLSRHWQMIGLVHSELVLVFLGILALLDRVLQNLVHLDFVADTGWRLRILDVVDIELLLIGMNVVLAATRCCASWV